MCSRVQGRHSSVFPVFQGGNARRDARSLAWGRKAPEGKTASKSPFFLFTMSGKWCSWLACGVESLLGPCRVPVGTGGASLRGMLGR